jgi:hypothetical protein
MDYQSSGVLEDYQNLALGVETLMGLLPPSPAGVLSRGGNSHQVFKLFYYDF